MSVNIATTFLEARRMTLQELQNPAEAVCNLASPSGVLTRSAAEEVASLLKALADPARIQLLSFIRASNDGEACVCNLTGPLGLSQPTVSHHLKVLKTAGIISREKRGTWVWYRVDEERWQQLAPLIGAES